MTLEKASETDGLAVNYEARIVVLDDRLAHLEEEG